MSLCNNKQYFYTIFKQLNSATLSILIYNYAFSGGKDESCSKKDQCQTPMDCISGICNCPLNTTYVSTIGLIGMHPVSRCIPSGGKFSFAIPYI